MAIEEIPSIPAPDEARAVVRRLVERFSEHLDEYKRGAYNETQVRREFIDPFFHALGWDVANENGYVRAYQEVIHEDTVLVGGKPKAPDYSFRIGGQRRFFVEAKKPAVRVGEDRDPAYQLRRYAWSAKLPLSIVTDFEEFAVYESRHKPKPTDAASVDRLFYFTYEQYDEKLDWIHSHFSMEAIQRGAFDRLAASTEGKRGTAQVDTEFLKEIEGWREALAKDIARANAGLTVHELNTTVQTLIDRILFLRIAEDRGVETYEQLRGLAQRSGIYSFLWDLFVQAEQKYDSGLFDFGKTGDGLANGLHVSDKALKSILKGLYYPECPYEFSVIGADILGAVYERFLGKVIRLTAGHQAKVEEKPEVRKAGGVYYTPTYIVDYIVEHTVGDLLRDWEESLGRAPTDEPPVLRVLDPACGSGSFLLGAYQYILDWHLRRYTATPASRTHWSRGKRQRIVQRSADDWRLTLLERKRILTECIFGVDIDRQAVEVTKLNLLLKCLEGEAGPAPEQKQAISDRILPNIDANIRCGNSLIGPDYWAGRLSGLVDPDEERRVNPFDWAAGFPAVLGPGGHGGFDAVIGNPPYIRIQALREAGPEVPDYLKKHYRTAAKGSCDIYVAFVERGMSLLCPEGTMGYILPNKFLVTDYGQGLRAHIAQRQALRLLVNFGAEQVFAGATTYTCLLFVAGGPVEEAHYLQAQPGPAIAAPPSVGHPIGQVPDGPWEFGSTAQTSLLSTLAARGRPLGSWPCEISRGSSTGADTVFVLKRGLGGHLAPDGAPVEIEPDALRTPIYATDFGRYRFAPAAQADVVFPYTVDDRSYSLTPEPRLARDFPAAYSYLGVHRRLLARRKSGGAWYGFSAPRNLAQHDRAQLLVPLLASRGEFAPFEHDGEYCPMASGGFSLTVQRGEHDLSYLLGVLNSAAVFWYLQRISNVFRGGWVTCTKQYVSRLPIRVIDFSDPADVGRHDKMVSLVETMLDLHKRVAEARTPADRELIQRRIDATDRQIDELVYELYGLTEDEIAIVEGREG